MPLFLFIILVSSAFALNIEFVGPCDGHPFLSESLPAGEDDNVGELTVSVLERSHIPFQGSERGLNQVLNSPVGLEAMEVISDNEMLSYGWCFEIDGQIPELYLNEIKLDNSIHHIRWFYGYAHYLNGEWISQCQESFRRKSPFICGRDSTSINSYPNSSPQ